MNKNTVTGLLIIALAFWFFNSPAYYKLIGQPYPTKTVSENFSKDDSTIKDVAVAETMVSAVSTDSTIAEMVEAAMASDSIIDSSKIVPQIVYDTIVVDNGVLSLTFTEKGGRIISAKAINYLIDSSHSNGGELVELFQNRDGGIGGLSIGSQNFDSLHFNLDSTDVNKGIYKFVAQYQGSKISKSYTVSDSSYYIDYSVSSSLLKDKNSSLIFDAGITESESKDGLSFRYSPRQVSLLAGKKVQKKSLKAESSVTESGDYRWVGVNSKYFSVIAIPEIVKNSDVAVKGSVINRLAKVDANNMNYGFSFENLVLTDSESYTLFLGPNKVSELRKADKDLEKLVFRGYSWFFAANLWFPKLCSGVLWLMGLFFAFTHDYGVAIILLTLLLKIVTFPLTNSSMKSMSKMKEMQPRLAKIQEKYKGKPQQLQAKMMEFYKEEGVNPLAGMGAGCLPMFAQMPIMISLFIVLRKAIELRGETTVIIPWLKDLSQPEALFALPFDIPFYGSNFALLPVVMAVLMYFQNKMTMKDPNQKAMVAMMPVMMLVMFNNFPSGLTLYFTFSSAVQIIQQILVDKRAAKNVSVAVVVK